MMCLQHHTEKETLYLLEFFDKLGSFNTTLHIKADVHFDLSKGVSQFDDGNLGTCDTSVNSEHNSTFHKTQGQKYVYKYMFCLNPQLFQV